jgi:dCMP deaminase
MLEPDQYYMNLAVAASARANCSSRKVGAVLVANDRVVSTGYNGTPSGFTNCEDGGCWRCKEAKERNIQGEKYDLCICVHAEQNALLTAARHGIRTADATIYTTLAPCFSCLKEALQAGVVRIVYLGEPQGYPKEKELEKQYENLAKHMAEGVNKLDAGLVLSEWRKQARGEPESDVSALAAG